MYRRQLFNLPDRATLWDDSDDEEDNNRSNIEVIVVSSSPEPDVQSTASALVVSTQPDELVSFSPPPRLPLFSSVQPQQTIVSYIQRTLQHSSRRYSSLPAFPASLYNEQPPSLLANVPGMSEKSRK